jgi:hypothetical protein
MNNRDRNEFQREEKEGVFGSSSVALLWELLPAFVAKATSAE